MLDAENPADEQAPAETATPSGEQTPTDQAPVGEDPGATPAKKAAKKTTAKKAAAKKTTAKKATAKRATGKKAAAGQAGTSDDVDVPLQGTEVPQPTPETAEPAPEPTPEASDAAPAAAKKTAKKAATKKAAAKKAPARKSAKKAAAEQPAEPTEPAAGADEEAAAPTAAPSVAVPLFQPPAPTKAAPRRRKKAETEATDGAPAEGAQEAAEKPAAKKAAKKTAKKAATRSESAEEQAAESAEPAETDAGETDAGEDTGEGGSSRRRRRRGGRRRRKSGGAGDSQDQDSEEPGGEVDAEPGEAAENGGESTSTRRRRRRRRAGEEGEASPDDPENTVTRVRRAKSPEDEITALSGSTRLEAKKQRRREGREAGRRRAPIVSEAEFLARREAVDRVMVIRQREDLTQIAVLEDKVLVEHYVARESQTSLIGNVYLGRVQNVLPSMEAAFIDIGKGRNAVLYAGEVNWDALGAGNGPRKIEQVLKSGQSVLVQVTKDPVGHKGARLTSQISLPGRFLVYVPDGTTSGISRKLPDTERNRLKNLLKEIVPDTAGVIVRTAAEGASEEELTRDVERLTARWEDISAKVAKGNAPQLLYGEPDLTLKVVRDLFTEDFGKLVVSGDDAWDMVDGYVRHVAPDLADRLERWDGDRDVFAAYRIDEQIAKALDRKVWLPSGGSLIIDRTEAMTVVDVNTGKFTGSGGNLEETVTKNNLEAAEEIVRQLRLRDIGGIIVVDFIDMVLESNRDLVLRRMVECLGRDRTRHQVAEVTSLGLVQMTRKRIGTGLLEAFSESCEHCQGRGLIVHHEPIEPKKKVEEEPRRGRRGRRGKAEEAAPSAPSPKDVAAMAKQEAEAAAAETAEAEAGHEVEAAAGTGAEGAAEKVETGETPAAEGRGRTRRRSGRARSEAGRAEKPEAEKPEAAEEPAVEESEAEKPAAEKPAAARKPKRARPEPAEQAEPRGAEEAPAPTEQPEQPPAPPRVVTSSRRRVARRPAGPPPGATAATSVLTAEPSTAETSEAGATEPDAAEASSNGSGRAAAASPPESPESTGAGAPVTGGADGADGGGDETGPAEQDHAPASVHVPVKKKGSRKR